MRRARALSTALLLAAPPVLAGCQKALFPKDMPRTQFEKHDHVQGLYIPLEEPDVFGKPQPALRARLVRE